MPLLKSHSQAVVENLELLTQRPSPSGSSLGQHGSSIYPYGYPTAAGSSGPQHCTGFLGQPGEHGGSGAASPAGGAAAADRHGSAAGTVGSDSSDAASAMGASGVMGMAIRRMGAGQQWSATHTHPQQDQQARHRLPSQAAAAGASPFGGWPGPAVLGQWFSSTVQHPLAAATGRMAAGVGQRVGSAAAAAAAGVSRATSQAGATAARSSSSAAAGNHQGAAAGAWDVGWGPDSFEDAVLVEHSPDMPQSLQEQEDEAFRGLLFLGGRDSHGRPVVVVNTDAIPVGHNVAPRDAALAYLIKRLTPVVTRLPGVLAASAWCVGGVCLGPYVLVLVAFQRGPHFRLLPGVWCVRAYQSLPRAFRKNVKHVLLLQPSLLARAGLALLYPFVSSKAHGKVKQVQRLLDIEAATAGEVQASQLLSTARLASHTELLYHPHLYICC
ncbi:hypothetical protein COO60DRAFT_1626257 [Scenedesmus sp. NREL 46B-D3]|nr:hypothetical protein COO60DRAFT_1626257 [Scenedesmus sp. NREL 46B-D3]